MSQKFPLHSILHLSQLRLDEATLKLGQLIASEQEAGKRFDLLVEYRAEYHARFLVAAKAGIGPKEWENFQKFLQRLDEAVNQADKFVQQTRKGTSTGQQEWISKKGRVQAFDTLALRHQAKLDYQGMRRDAKTEDEHTARRHHGESSEITDESELEHSRKEPR